MIQMRSIASWQTAVLGSGRSKRKRKDCLDDLGEKGFMDWSIILLWVFVSFLLLLALYIVLSVSRVDRARSQ